MSLFGFTHLPPQHVKPITHAVVHTDPPASPMLPPELVLPPQASANEAPASQVRPRMRGVYSPDDAFARSIRPSIPMKNFGALFEAMHEACDPRRQKCLAIYFDTGSNAARTKSPFYGLTAVAAVAARKVALRFADEFRPSDLRPLFASGVNEHRFVALEILVRGRPSLDEA